MRVLMVKTSSMGDVIHTLPALTDAAKALPGLRFDWVVEESFAEIPSWHCAVDQVFEVAIRRWRKEPLKTLRARPWGDLRRCFQERDYALTVDAQGLLKSAWIGLLAGAPRYGLDWHSAREPLSSLFYQHRIAVSWEQHAVQRVRELLARALDYPVPTGDLDYGIDPARLDSSAARPGCLVFLHATTWPDKHWPEQNWQQLCAMAVAAGYRVCLPWADEVARARAERLAADHEGVEVLPRLSLSAVVGLLQQARGAVAVDTGLGHLAAALEVPCVSMYGPTDPDRVGTLGRSQICLCGEGPEDYPLSGLDAERVWLALESLLKSRPMGAIAGEAGGEVL